ncbi:MAG: ABC transporter ATP-binding protein [Desulfomonile tiedjei]|nr:ABC transporter ATP-binding protein [Desulfomonile tiedjei]
MEPVIVFDRVSKEYPLYHRVTAGLKHFLLDLPGAIRSLRSTRLEVLRDVSFTVQRGESVGIIGRNGAGKSTLLLMIAGVIKPCGGTVTVRERVSPLLELGSGFHPDLSGRENIELNGVLLGLSRRQVLTKQDSIIEFSEIGDYIDQPIRTYSSGMVARLAFSVLVHLDPMILLIDEVLAVGDFAFEKKCLDMMLSFKGSGVTTVLVSHALPQVEQMCDRVIWIEDRSIRCCGAPSEVIAAYIEHSKPTDKP